MVPVLNFSRVARLAPAVVLAAIFAALSLPALAQTAGDPDAPPGAGPPSSAGTPDTGLQPPPGAAEQATVSPASILRGTDPDASPLGFPDDDPTLPTRLPAPEDNSVINYGKPRPKKPILYTPTHKVTAPLPPLVRYPTAPGVKPRKGASPEAVPLPAPPPPTVAVVPTLPVPRKLPTDDTPFDPLGIDVGTLRLKPFVETSVGYDTNPNRQSAGVTASPFLETEGGVGLASNWSQHSLTADLRGGYADYFRVPNANHPDANATVDGRIDVTRDTKINLEGRFALTTQTPGSPQLAIPGSTFIVNRPSIYSYGGTVGVTQNFNRLNLGLKGTVDRFTFDDATLSDGSTLALSTSNYNAYGLTGHVGYELTPGLIPFAEVTGDTRKHDDFVDYTGYERDSNGISGRAGSTFEITRIITGDLAVGYADRHYVDPRLPNLNGPTVDGSLTYTLTPLTTITAKANTYLSETTQAGVSGAVSRTVSLQLAHALFRNFTLTGIATYTNNDYQGQPITENYFSGQLKADYSVTRDIILRASYTHERLASSLVGSSFNADVFQLGVRLQR